MENLTIFDHNLLENTIVPDELQVFNDMVKIVFVVADPFMHERRIKDIPQFGLVDNHPFRLFGYWGFLFNDRSLFPSYRLFLGRLFLDYFRLRL